MYIISEQRVGFEMFINNNILLIHFLEVIKKKN